MISFFSLVLALIPAISFAGIKYDWKLGVYNAPQWYSFEQKDENLGKANGSAFIIENFQFTIQRKYKDWIIDSAVNYSSLNLESPDKKETVNLVSLYVGTIYKRNWIANIQFEQMPIIDSSQNVSDFKSLNTTWASIGYQQKVIHPRIQVFGILSYPVLINSTAGTVERSSGYKLNIGTDYRVRLQKSWDLYLRPFIEYKHWEIDFKNQNDQTELTIIQYGLRFGVNKFF